MLGGIYIRQLNDGAFWKQCICSKYDKDDGITITGEIEFNDAGFITNSVPDARR